MTTRADIVAALAAVDGLAAQGTRPATITAGMAWPGWRNTRWANAAPGGVRLTAWYVYVALPDAGEDATVAEGDPLVEAVGMALIGAGLQIELVEPLRVVTTEGQAGVPVLRYSVTD